MSAAGISKILEHTPRLETLRYGHEFKHNSRNQTYGVYWDAGKFVDAIENHVGGHLKHLTVQVEQWGVKGITGNVTSMNGFTKLETLELDLMVLAGSSRWMLRNTLIPPLYETLPTSIRQFALLGKMGGEDDGGRMDVALHLYRGFKSAYRSRLSNLESYSARFCSIADIKKQCLRREQKSALQAEGVAVFWARILTQISFATRRRDGLTIRSPPQQMTAKRRKQLSQRYRKYKPLSVPSHDSIIVSRL